MTQSRYSDATVRGRRLTELDEYTVAKASPIGMRTAELVRESRAAQHAADARLMYGVAGGAAAGVGLAYHRGKKTGKAGGKPNTLMGLSGAYNVGYSSGVRSRPVAKAGPTLYQSAVYDGRFGFPGQEKGKKERKEVRRAGFQAAVPAAVAGGGIGYTVKQSGRLPFTSKKKAIAGGALGGLYIGQMAGQQIKRHEVQHREGFGKGFIPTPLVHAAGALRQGVQAGRTGAATSSPVGRTGGALYKTGKAVGASPLKAAGATAVAGYGAGKINKAATRSDSGAHGVRGPEEQPRQGPSTAAVTC